MGALRCHAKKLPANRYEAAIRSHEWVFIREGLFRCLMCKALRRKYHSGNSRFQAFGSKEMKTGCWTCPNAAAVRPGRAFPWKLTEAAFCREIEEVLG
jgi:hypothetical protein